jgi:hypothetical protein
MLPENILYRTRTIILTERRIIARGDNYSLQRITAVRTKRTWYYVPLQVLRLLSVLGILVGIGLFARHTTSDLSLTDRLLPLLLAALVGLPLFLALRWVPGHVVQVELDSTAFEVARSNDVRQLRAVAGTFSEAAARANS